MTERFKDIFKYWLPAILWAAGIFYLSSVPSLKSALPSAWDFILRKAAHMAEYAMLAVLVLRVLKTHGIKGLRAYAFSLAICLLYASSDEYHQTFVYGRSGSPLDVAVDAVGMAAGLAACKAFENHRKK